MSMGAKGSGRLVCSGATIMVKLLGCNEWAKENARRRSRLFFVVVEGVVDGLDDSEDCDDSTEVHDGFLWKSG